MIKNNEPYLIEYNVRMGDPECQTLLPKLETDLFEIIAACCEKRLNKINIEWNNKRSLCVVLCSKGYPDTYKKNVEIKNINKLNLKIMITYFMLALKKKIIVFLQQVDECLILFHCQIIFLLQGIIFIIILKN